MTATREVLREAVAGAVRPLLWERKAENIAAAALAAIEAAGWMVVPVEATFAQQAAGADRIDGDMRRASRIYRAMLSAAPRIAEKE